MNRAALLAGVSAISVSAAWSGAFAAPCTGTFSYTGMIAGCTTGAAGTYRITAYGAQGGSANYGHGYNTVPGGRGAVIGGDFFLPMGTTLNILAGQQGGYGYGHWSGAGGGGGSFVVDLGTGDPLVVAGGGGGAYGGFGTYEMGGDAYTGNYGDYGGYGGEHKSGNDYTGNGGGGGGFGVSSDGTDGLGGSYYGPYVPGGGGGKSYANGGTGGAGSGHGSYYGGDGGFGGGGGGYSGYFGGGGGGGGYTGGDGGAGSYGYGGGSFLNPLATNPIQMGGDYGNYGDGFVRIYRLSQISVPEPGTLGALATGLLGLGALRRRRRRKKD